MLARAARWARGAGGIALLMLLADEAVGDIIKANAVPYGAYSRLKVPSLLKTDERSEQGPGV